jgi:sugar lactone lactonase YvrE
MYYRVETEKGDNTLYYQSASGVQKEVLAGKVLPLTGGGTLSADGQTLFWTSGIEIRAFAVAEDGSVQDEGRFAEIFLGDGRYGQPRTKEADGGPGGVALDRKGRLFLASRVGLQVFDPTGKLLGVVQVPTQPLACVLDGTEKMLYVAGARQVYAVPLR